MKKQIATSLLSVCIVLFSFTAFGWEKDKDRDYGRDSGDKVYRSLRAQVDHLDEMAHNIYAELARRDSRSDSVKGFTKQMSQIDIQRRHVNAELRSGYIDAGQVQSEIDRIHESLHHVEIGLSGRGERQEKRGVFIRFN